MFSDLKKIITLKTFKKTGNLPVSYAIQKFESLNKKGTTPLVSSNGPSLGRSSTINSGNTSPTNINRSNSNITAETEYYNR